MAHNYALSVICDKAVEMCSFFVGTVSFAAESHFI